MDVCVLGTVPPSLAFLSLPHTHIKDSWVHFQEPRPYRSPFRPAILRGGLWTCKACRLLDKQRLCPPGTLNQKDRSWGSDLPFSGATAATV